MPNHTRWIQCTLPVDASQTEEATSVPAGVEAWLGYARAGDIGRGAAGTRQGGNRDRRGMEERWLDGTGVGRWR